MYVLVTTANNPNVMMPALERSRWAALFFVTYLIINLYMFMSVFLAVVYNQFRCNLKQEVKEAKERKEDLLNKVFDNAVGIGQDKMEKGKWFLHYVHVIILISERLDKIFM